MLWLAQTDLSPLMLLIPDTVNVQQAVANCQGAEQGMSHSFQRAEKSSAFDMPFYC